MIGIIDYGLGNVKAFLNCYKELNVYAEAVLDPTALQDFSHIILPGVGSFDEAMTKLHKSGFDSAIRLALDQGAYLLGVCVGMQVLADKSNEGTLPGLGLVPGEVIKFGVDSDIDLITPHMGWNQVNFDVEHPIFFGLESEDTEFYFLHSYYFVVNDERYSISSSNYGSNFVSGVNKENIFGFQFHPEKSHETGRILLNNFSKLG